MAICYNKHLCDLSDARTLIPTRYCDADWGNNEADRYSVSGVIYTLCGGPISWSSHTKKCIALSSTEAELNALSDSVKQALYLHKHFAGLSLSMDSSIIIYNDNQSALLIANSNPGAFTGRLKHYDIKACHIKDTIAKKLISLQYCATADMPADLLTKALGRVKLLHLMNKLQLQRPTSN